MWTGRIFDEGNSKNCSKECRKWMNHMQIRKHTIQYFRSATYHTCAFNMAHAGAWCVQAHASGITHLSNPGQ